MVVEKTVNEIGSDHCFVVEYHQDSDTKTCILKHTHTHTLKLTAS